MKSFLITFLPAFSTLLCNTLSDNMQLKKFKEVFLPLMLDQLSSITQAFEKIIKKEFYHYFNYQYFSTIFMIPEKKLRTEKALFFERIKQMIFFY